MIDYELEFLLSLNNSEFRFEGGYYTKIIAKLAKLSKGRPAGIKYSMTLHDGIGNRIYGIDNAHSIKDTPTFDHWHVYGSGEIRPYPYSNAAQLVDDFFWEVMRILNERGIR